MLWGFTMASLKDIQIAELEMLKYMDYLCREYNLKYSLNGGTLLGAVRHKGFIPWDDDIDTYMSIEDFRAFSKHFDLSRYFLQMPLTDIEACYPIYKIRAYNTYMPEDYTEQLHMNKGVWIDIFVYMNAGVNGFFRKIQFGIYNVLRTYRCRYLHIKNKDARWYHYLACKLPKIVAVQIDSFLVSLIELCGSKKSEFYFCMDVGKVYFYKKELFDNLVLYQFEDGKFWGIKDYDKYLQMIYGADYMIPKKWGHVGDYSKVIL